MTNEEMEQETQGKTTKDNDNQDQIQIQDSKLLSLVAGVDLWVLR
jgi:hypothetical protein